MTNRKHTKKKEQNGDLNSEHIIGPEGTTRSQEQAFPRRKELSEELATSKELLEINRQLLKATRLMAKGTVYGILVGAIAAVAFFLQFCAMSQQTHILSDQAAGDAASASLSAVQTQNQLQVAQKQASSAKDTITTMRRQITLYERAWLGTSDYTYTITESGPIGSTVLVTNTGKSPAMDIVCRSSGTTKPRGYVLRRSDITYPASLHIIRQGTLFPNQRFPLRANSQPMEGAKQKMWFESVQKGDRIQYFFGEVRYRDIFGETHFTHFCTQFIPTTKNGTPCPIYNGTDNVGH